MSSFNKLHKAASGLYNEFTDGVKLGWSYIRAPLKLLGKAGSWIQHKAKHASHIPLANDILSLLVDNPVFAEGLGLVNSANATLDDFGKIGTDLDSIIRKVGKFGEVHPLNNITSHHSYTHPHIPMLINSDGTVRGRSSGESERSAAQRGASAPPSVNPIRPPGSISMVQ